MINIKVMDIRFWKRFCIVLVPLAIFCLLFTYSCANIARPSGGPRDETPPRYVRSSPTPNQLNFNKSKIEIEFDEIVLLESPTTKIVVSPPQKQMPVTRASGHTVTIELKDSLLPNTTYTIDFSDAIVDNNEKNPLKDFSIAFSTGEVLDTMQVSGVLLNAEDLEPITGMYVGIQSNLSDTAFTHTSLQRIALSDDKGHFTIKNIAPGSYRLFALKDSNRDYKFDTSTEDIAFFDSIIVPSVEMTTHTDTLWRKEEGSDSAIVDSIWSHSVPVYLPNDLVLRSFNENKRSQYLEKEVRNVRNKLELTFSTPADTLPTISPINFEAEEWAWVERSVTNDTLTYWITDSLALSLDTLLLEIDYLRTDSLDNLSPYTDTLKLIYREPKTTISNRDKKQIKDKEPLDSIPEKEPITFLGVKLSASGEIDIYNPITITFDQPVLAFDSVMVVVEEKVDTIWQPYPFTLEADTAQIRSYYVRGDWKSEGEYRVSLDSAMVTGVYGIHNKPEESNFSIKSVEKYANLFISLVDVQDSAFVQLLDTSDKPVRMATVEDGMAIFMYLNPGEYYARIVIDKNGNNKYDTGDYALRKQPEEVYYNSNKFSLKANWDVEQSWQVYGTELERQKPRAIVKNRSKEELKAEEERKKREAESGITQDDEEEDYELPF